MDHNTDVYNTVELRDASRITNAVEERSYWQRQIELALAMEHRDHMTPSKKAQESRTRGNGI